MLSPQQLPDLFPLVQHHIQVHATTCRYTLVVSKLACPAANV
jgi:hypothetical protein